jgi:glutathione reductase (NADPH)
VLVRTHASAVKSSSAGPMSSSASAWFVPFRCTARARNTGSGYTARRTREQHAAYKILIDTDTHKILGAHLLSTHAGEVIDMFALAIRHDLTAHDVKTSILAYPAAASDVAYML